MINILVDELPYEVEIDGQMFEINTDFRVSILFELLMQDDEATDEEKITNALMLYYPEIPFENINEAIEKVLWFYGCGKIKSKKRKNSDEYDEDYDSSSSTRAYSFEYDDIYIYAAFKQQYGIDLNDIEYMHWWKFRALFRCLTDDCEIVKIMGYRTQKITNDMSKKQKEHIRKMQRLYALPVSEADQELSDALTEALMNGGDISKLLNGGQ